MLIRYTNKRLLPGTIETKLLGAHINESKPFLGFKH